ncbi:hypothetical protein D3C73_1347230 [compost metagenome]
MQNHRLLIITSLHDIFKPFKKLCQNILQLVDIKGEIDHFKQLQLGGAKLCYRLL